MDYPLTIVPVPIMHRYYDYGGQVLHQECRILSTTRAGCWVDDYGKKRFVLAKATKRWAHETEEGAMVSFLARKHRQIAILAARINLIQEAVDSASGMLCEAAPKTKSLPLDFDSL